MPDLPNAVRRRKLRFRRACLAGGMAALLLASLVAMLPAAAATKAVSVSPSTGLQGGQQVTVTWEGYTAGGVFVRQCKPDVKSATADCLANQVASSTRSDGTGSTTFFVSYVDSGSVRCTETSPCQIGVFVGLNVASAAFAPISFATPTPTSSTTSTSSTTTTTQPSTTTTTKPLPTCEQSVGEPLRLSGASSADQALQRFARVVCQPGVDVPLDFTQRNSYGGRADFITGAADVGVSARGFTSDELAELKAQGREKEFMYVPILASALVCPFRIAYNTGTVADLRLSPKSLAGISNGTLPNLAIETIAADNAGNPQLPRDGQGNILPKGLTALVRADQAFATYLLTQYFYAHPEAQRQWELPSGDRFVTGPTESFPSEQGVDLRVGAYRVLAELEAPSLNFPTLGLVGCVDSSVWQTGVPLLPAASLRNASGAYVPPTDASMAAGVADMVSESNGILRPGFEFKAAAAGTGLGASRSEPGAYALPTVTYAIVPSTGLSDEKKAWVAKTFDYILGEGQKNLPPGYVPLPSAILESAKKGVAMALAGEGTGGAVPIPGTDPVSLDTGFSDFATSFGSGSLLSGGDLGSFDASASADPASDGTASDGDGVAALGAQLVRLVTGDGKVPLVLLLAALGLLLLVAGPLLQMRGDPELAAAFAGATHRIRSVPGRGLARLRRRKPGAGS